MREERERENICVTRKREFKSVRVVRERVEEEKKKKKSLTENNIMAPVFIFRIIVSNSPILETFRTFNEYKLEKKNKKEREV